MTVLERPQPRPGVLKIQAYVPGKSSAPGVAKIFKLSSNETPLGASPKAIAAYGAIGKHLEDYPDGASTELREAIGRAYGLDPGRIVCGAGSDDLLNPTPEDRWSYYESIGMVSKLMGNRMYPLTLHGLEMAMRTLTR